MRYKIAYGATTCFCYIARLTWKPVWSATFSFLNQVSPPIRKRVLQNEPSILGGVESHIYQLSTVCLSLVTMPPSV